MTAVSQRAADVKFSQLATGTRFSYRGATFRKVAPLQAVREDQDSDEPAKKLIPRSANVTLLDESGAVVDTDVPVIAEGQSIEHALALLGKEISLGIRQISPALNESQSAQLQQLIDKARQQALTRLAFNKAGTGDQRSSDPS